MLRLLQAFVCLGVLLLAGAAVAPPGDVGRRPFPRRSPGPQPSISPCPAYVSEHDLENVPTTGVYSDAGMPTMPPWLAHFNDQTPPPQNIPPASESQVAADQATGQQALANQNYGTPSPYAACPSDAPVAPANGTLLQKLWTAAAAFRGTDTCWAGTDCGQEACAASVQAIVRNATGVTISDYSVDDWRRLAMSSPYGGSIVTPDHASAGAIIIWPDQVDPVLGHMGFCANDGCTQTWSNSSSKHTFAPRTWGLYFDGTYSNYLIWEPAHIP